jgi:hypothetical protein
LRRRDLISFLAGALVAGSRVAIAQTPEHGTHLKTHHLARLGFFKKCLILLALPRGLKPLFSP